MSGNRIDSEQTSSSNSQADEKASISAWRVVGASVQGAAHVRAGLPNQDAFIQWLPATDSGPPALAAVSDGHGGPTHFRSGDGARLAVETAAQVLRDFLSAIPGRMTAKELDSVARMLPRKISEAWRVKVTLDATQNPFTEEELAKLTQMAGAEARPLVDHHHVLAYGATLLAVLVADAFVLYLQLGDGDILTVDENGLTSRPFPPDSRLIANQTTSLCQPEAWTDFRLLVDVNPPRLPSLILLSTDGYANAFRSDDDFLQIGRDYLEIVRGADLTQLSAQLKEFLADASRNGSGDDVTLALLQRTGGSAAQPTTTKIHDRQNSVSLKEILLSPIPQIVPADDSKAPVQARVEPAPLIRGRFVWPVVIIIVLALLGLGAFVIGRKALQRKAVKIPPPVHGPSQPKPAPSAHLGLSIGSGSAIILTAGAQLTGAQAGFSGPAASAVVAEVTTARPGSNAVELTNRSKEAWSVVSPDGRHSRTGPGEGLQLVKGMRIRFAARAPVAEVVEAPEK